MQEDGLGSWHASPQEFPTHRYKWRYLGKKKDRYIFKVESIGSLSPVTIVRKAMAVLREKLKDIEEGINWYVPQL